MFDPSRHTRVRNLQADVTIEGVPIDDYIRRVISSSGGTQGGSGQSNKMEELLAEKLKPLIAFNDEKRILSQTINEVSSKIAELESSKESKNDQWRPRVESELQALTETLSSLDKRFSEIKTKRGVDHGTLQSSIVELKTEMIERINEVTKDIEKLRSDLEE